MMDWNDITSVKQAAAVLSLHPDTVRKWIRIGRVPAFGPRGAWRVRLSDLLQPVRPERLAKISGSQTKNHLYAESASSGCVATRESIEALSSALRAASACAYHAVVDGYAPARDMVQTLERYHLQVQRVVPQEQWK